MPTQLRVAIDVRPLALGAVSGVGLVVAQILEELEGRGVTFVGLSDRSVPGGRAPSSVDLRSCPGPAGRISWESQVLPHLLRRLEPRPDLYHATWNHGLPGGLPFPSVLTLHDLIPWRLPRSVPWPRPAWLHRRLYRGAVRGAARRAAGIVTVSQASRRDIEALLPGQAMKVTVVPNALPKWFRRAGPEQGASFRERLAGGRPYWLYLGGFDPRKGIETLLGAAAAAFPEHRDLPDLVLAGEKNASAIEYEGRALALGLRAHFPGYLPDADLPALFAGASLFLYPSEYEGFGIPLLFAMAAGVPIVASDAGAIPEVAGDAALLFPAGDAGSLGSLLRAAAARPDDLARRGALGPERVARFSVDALAKGMLQVYESAAKNRGGSA